MAAANSDRPNTAVVTDAGPGTDLSRPWIVEVVEGPDAGRTWQTDRGTWVAGSHPEVDVHLSDPAVSRYHAELRMLADGVLVVDLGSRNGVRVGRSKVQQVLVPPDGQFRLGKTTLTVRAVQTPVVPADEVQRFGDFLTVSPAAQRVLKQLELVAKSEATVLILGETGTGKELLARGLHTQSPRHDHRLVVVDCGAVSPTLLEGQLFGHVKGAFTGAAESRVGAFEAAQGGTVFLDEIGELPLELQPKLLRVLEARTVRRLGETTDRAVDVRFVAATHRDLEAMVAAGTFREDLYFRIAVVQVRVPPLRERPDDIALLADAYADRLSNGRVQISSKAKDTLLQYDWPGNGRELRNVMERAVTLSQRSKLQSDDLFATAPTPREPEPFRNAKERVVAEFEKRYVKALLARHEGNVSGAAREAGMSRNALYALIKRVGAE